MAPWNIRILTSAKRLSSKPAASIIRAPWRHRPAEYAIPTHKTCSFRSASTQASSAEDVPVAGSAGPRPDGKVKGFHRAVYMLVPLTATRVDIARGMAETAPLGSIVFIDLKAPQEGKDKRLATVMFAHSKTARRFVQFHAKTRKVQIKGEAPFVYLNTLLTSKTQRSDEFMTTSRVVLVCAPHGKLPGENDIRQRLTDGPHTDSWETEPLVTYSVPGNDGAEVDVLEWRFFQMGAARLFAKELHSQRHPDVYAVFGKDPCQGRANPAKANRKLALDAMTDHTKRALAAIDMESRGVWDARFTLRESGGEVADGP